MERFNTYETPQASSEWTKVAIVDVMLGLFGYWFLGSKIFRWCVIRN